MSKDGSNYSNKNIINFWKLPYKFYPDMWQLIQQLESIIKVTDFVVS